jgi:hypothetical protein
MEKYGTAGHETDENIQFMPFACWVPKATDTHSECAMRIALPLQP